MFLDKQTLISVKWWNSNLSNHYCSKLFSKWFLNKEIHFLNYNNAIWIIIVVAHKILPTFPFMFSNYFFPSSFGIWVVQLAVLSRRLSLSFWCLRNLLCLTYVFHYEVTSLWRAYEGSLDLRVLKQFVYF